MPPGPAPADPGREQSRPGMPPVPGQAPPAGDDGWEPVITCPDPVSAEELEAWLDHLAGEDEPFDPEEYPDPDGPPPPAAMMPMRAPRMRSWPGCCPRGTGWRPTWPPASWPRSPS